jgi:hypothetical protein
MKVMALKFELFINKIINILPEHSQNIDGYDEKIADFRL